MFNLLNTLIYSCADDKTSLFHCHEGLFLENSFWANESIGKETLKFCIIVKFLHNL